MVDRAVREKLQPVRATMARPSFREDWLAARAPFLGASEAGALFGEFPFATLGEIGLRKLGKLGKEPESAAMARGNYLEEAVAQWWATVNGEEVAEVEQLYVVGPHKEEGVLCATLDRHIVGKNVALEVKTTANYVDRPERYWWHQCQAQILCADLDRVELAVLDASMSLQSFTVEPDRAHLEELLTRATAFMRSIRLGILPADAQVGLTAARQLFPEAGIGQVTLDTQRMELVELLRKVKARKAELETEEDELAGTLALALGNCPDAVDENGKLVATWRNHRDVRLDTKALKAEHPELAKRFTRVGRTRHLRLK